MKTKIYRIPEFQKPSNIEGNGNNHLMIIGYDDDLAQHYATLSGLVKAIKKDINEDCVVVRLDRDVKYDINGLIDQYAIKEIITLGIDNDVINFKFNVPQHSWIRTEKFDLLKSVTIGQMNQNKSDKMSLWNQLQTYYAL